MQSVPDYRCSSIVNKYSLICPIPEGVQGQVGGGPGQLDLALDLAVGSPAHRRGLELDDP